MTMNTSLTLARPQIGATLAAIALSIVVATLLLLGVTELFVRDGLPLQNVVITERACSEYSFWSEREACVQSLLAASYHHRIASR
jgi:hypothetical protein